MRKHRPQSPLSKENEQALLFAASNTPRAREFRRFCRGTDEPAENYLQRLSQFFDETKSQLDAGSIPFIPFTIGSNGSRENMTDKVARDSERRYHQEVQRIKDEFVRVSGSFLKAAEQGNVERVKAILQTGFPVNFQDPATGQTALHIAAACQARAVVRVLLETEECDFLLRDRRGRLASEMAGVYGEDTALAEELRDRERKQADEQGIKLTRRPRPEA